MSELIINTETSTVKKQELLPFRLVETTHEVLGVPIPEYNVHTLPNSSMSDLVERLKMTMKLYGGIGLSANQCGVQERVFIAGSETFQMVCINPKIINLSGEVRKKREGCLSFPGLYLNIPRYEIVEFEYYTESGEKKTHKFDGLTAQLFQHEMEHMDGNIFTAHVGPLALKLAKERQAKLIKKIKRR